MTIEDDMKSRVKGERYVYSFYIICYLACSADLEIIPKALQYRHREFASSRTSCQAHSDCQLLTAFS